MGETVEWRRKTRELHNPHFDSTIWNDLAFRRDLPNVKLVHFANLKRDMPGEIRRIAAFLDITIDSAEYEKRAAAELGAACARWLASGEGIG